MTEVAGGDFVNVGPLKVAVWPEEIRLYRCEPAEDSIALIANPDIHRIQKPLIEKSWPKRLSSAFVRHKQAAAKAGKKYAIWTSWIRRCSSC